MTSFIDESAVRNTKLCNYNKILMKHFMSFKIAINNSLNTMFGDNSFVIY